MAESDTNQGDTAVDIALVNAFDADDGVSDDNDAVGHGGRLAVGDRAEDEILNGEAELIQFRGSMIMCPSSKSFNIRQKRTSIKFKLLIGH